MAQKVAQELPPPKPSEVRNALFEIIALAAVSERKGRRLFVKETKDADDAFLRGLVDLAKRHHDDVPVGRVGNHVVRASDAEIYPVWLAVTTLLRNAPSVPESPPGKFLRSLAQALGQTGHRIPLDRLAQFAICKRWVTKANGGPKQAAAILLRSLGLRAGTFMFLLQRLLEQADRPPEAGCRRGQRPQVNRYESVLHSRATELGGLPPSWTVPEARGGVAGRAEVVRYVLRICGYRDETILKVIRLLLSSKEMQPTIETARSAHRRTQRRRPRSRARRTSSVRTQGVRDATAAHQRRRGSPAQHRSPASGTAG